MFCEFRVVELRVEIFPVVPLKVTAFEVVEFVVEAFRVAKLAVVPHSVVIVPDTAEKIFEKRFVSTFKFVIEEVAATNELVLMFVEVEFVIVALVNDTPVKLRVDTFKFEIVALAIVVVEIVVVPVTDKVPVAIMFFAIVFP